MSIAFLFNMLYIYGKEMIILIKCNLAVLLAERNLKITQVANDTGISRTTITSLANNYSQGVQIDTLNKLCIYLQVSPQQFFSYIPFDFSIRAERQTKDFFLIYFNFKTKLKNISCSLEAVVESTSNRVLLDDDSGTHGTEITSVDISIFFADPSLQPDEISDDIKIENDNLKKYLSQIPIQFVNDIELEIAEKIVDSLDDTSNPDYSFSVSWPDELFSI